MIFYQAVVIIFAILVVSAAMFAFVHHNHKIVMSKLSELESALNTINITLEKARAEIVAAVAALQEQVNNSSDPELSANAQAQLDRLSAVATSLDQLNPDAPAEPTNPPQEA